VKGQGIYAYVTLMQDIEYSPELKKELVKTVRGHIGAFAAPDVIHWAPGGFTPPPFPPPEASLMLHQNPAIACALTSWSAFNATLCSVRLISGCLCANVPNQSGPVSDLCTVTESEACRRRSFKGTICAVLVHYMHAE